MARLPETLDRLPLIDEDSGDLNVVVETPKGSRNKYKYDAERGVMRLGATLGEGLVFPFDFGFFPSTRGEDGDPLDVLVFLDEGVPAGCVATARLIGVLEVEQKEKAQALETQRSYFAVATHAHNISASEAAERPAAALLAGDRGVLHPVRRSERQEACASCAIADREARISS